MNAEGDENLWDVDSDGVTVKSRAFWPTCGSPVYVTFPGIPEIFIIHAGSLDDPSRYKPQKVLWTAAGHAWDHLDPGAMKFEKMPPR